METKFTILKKIVLIGVFFGAVSCSEPIGIEGTEESTGLLVVEGFISTEEKQHSLRLTQTVKYGSIFEVGGLIRGVEDALVLIRDDMGVIFELFDDGDGFYKSSVPFSAEIGRSYSLLIELPDGRAFLSLPVLVDPVAPINSLTYQYDEVLDLEENDTLRGLEVSVSFSDPLENDNFYLWQAEGLYELSTFPSLHEVPLITDTGVVAVPDPKECCPTCWHTEDFELPRFDSDNLFNGNEVTRPAIFIEDNGIRFYNEKYDSVFLDPNELEQRMPQVIIKDDCRETLGTTTVRPAFWD